MKSDENAPLAVSLKCTEADFGRLKAYGEPFESPGRALTRALDRAEELETRIGDAVELIDTVFDQDDGKHPTGYYSALRQILTGRCTGCGEVECNNPECRYYGDTGGAPRER